MLLLLFCFTVCVLKMVVVLMVVMVRALHCPLVGGVVAWWVNHSHPAICN
jgi:hypothetical protein